MARLMEICLATIALMVASTFAVPLPCGGGNTGIVPPHCVTTCVHPNNCGEPFIPIIEHEVDDFPEHHHHFDHDDYFDDDRFEFDDEDFFDEDEFEDDDCEEGEDFLDGGDFDNEDTDFGEDNDCHNHIHGCIQY